MDWARGLEIPELVQALALAFDETTCLVLTQKSGSDQSSSAGGAGALILTGEDTANA